MWTLGYLNYFCVFILLSFEVSISAVSYAKGIVLSATYKAYPYKEGIVAECYH